MQEEEGLHHKAQEGVQRGKIIKNDIAAVVFEYGWFQL